MSRIDTSVFPEAPQSPPVQLPGHPRFDPMAAEDLIRLLGMDSDEDKTAAVVQLALLVDCTFGEDAATLGMMLRQRDGVPRLVHLLDHQEPVIHQSAMLILGNLSTESVDPNAEQELRNASLVVDILSYPSARNVSICSLPSTRTSLA